MAGSERSGVPPRRRRPTREPGRAYATMRTVHALERLALGPLSGPELALALQVHPRTARRLLQRLQVEHFAAAPSGSGAVGWRPSAARRRVRW